MTVEDGKKDAVTKKNKLIAETEKQLSNLNYKLSSAEGQVRWLHDSNISYLQMYLLQKYQNLCTISNCYICQLNTVIRILICTYMDRCKEMLYVFFIVT